MTAIIRDNLRMTVADVRMSLVNSVGHRPAGSEEAAIVRSILMNRKGIGEPASHDREVVDLLFFPTGGGKTEAL
ncbi:MAG: hypothetical protein U0791_26285 [Gemmataceae bacterium]